MNIQFGASYAIAEKLNRPNGVSEAQMKRAARRFMDDPVVQHFMEFDIADEVRFTLRPKPESQKNEVVVQVDVPDSAKLPASLKKYVDPQPVLEMAPEDLLDEQGTAAHQQWLNQELVHYVDEFDALYDMGMGPVKTPPQPDEQVLASQNKAKLARGKAGLALVAGMEPLKDFLKTDILPPLTDPAKCRSYGLGVGSILFYGPPGTGKTHLAERLIEETGLPCIKMEGSSIASPYIHQTVKLIGEMFDKAAKMAPCTILMNDFEAFLPKRTGLDDNQNYKKEEVGELLNRMEECAKKGIMIVGTTNHPEMIDPAVLRPGRMDVLQYIPPPDVDAREASLRHHLKPVRRKARSIDYAGIAAKTEGFSQADLRDLIQQAAKLAMREDRPVATRHLDEALAKTRPSISRNDLREYRQFPSRGTPVYKVDTSDRTLGFSMQA